ncbi:MAG: hypothetical protein J6Z04_00355 [Clostridia bacterium]|nr:hypothetical protein [Clostridia bacterium]
MKKEEKKRDPVNEEKKHDAAALAARALIFLFAAVSAVGAVICFRQGFGPGRLGVRIGWYVGGSASAILSCIAWFIFAASLNPAPRNLFLYDRETKTDIPVGELTWERIDERLAGCFAYYFANRHRLSAMPDVLHPLFLPFYLLQFTEAGDADVDRLLKNKEMVDSASRALSALGLDDDGRLLLYHFGSYEGDCAPFRAFLAGAGPRVKEKITEYVKTHIDEFV